MESIKDYICIHTVSGQYIIHQTLSGFTAALPQDRFLRIHRSYTVSIAWIESLSGSTLRLAGRDLPISLPPQLPTGFLWPPACHFVISDLPFPAKSGLARYVLIGG